MGNINWRDVQTKNVVNNVDMSSLWTSWQNGSYKNKHIGQHKTRITPRRRHLEKNVFLWEQETHAWLRHFNLLQIKIQFRQVDIFTFNKHFDKENDCVHEPVITQPHHWRRLFITFYIVNFLLFKNENSTYLMKYTCVAKWIDILLTIDDCSLFILVNKRINLDFKTHFQQNPAFCLPFIFILLSLNNRFLKQILQT